LSRAFLASAAKRRSFRNVEYQLFAPGVHCSAHYIEVRSAADADRCASACGHKLGCTMFSFGPSSNFPCRISSCNSEGLPEGAPGSHRQLLTWSGSSGDNGPACGVSAALSIPT
jgi:hypothetical protein